jgi:thiol-disulfide isomerase/thioredoxin
MFRNLMAVTLAALTLLASAPLHAAETRAFDRAAFAAAQAAGKPIIVAVKAWWCPVCASQGGTIKDAVQDPAYANLVVFQINYDKQKAELPAFAARKQGTILAYRGPLQVGRLDFVTDKPRIRALIAQTLH